MRLTRYFMYNQLQKCFPNKIKGKILGISELDGLSFLIHPESDVIETHYPEADIQRLPYEDNIFDYVISDQVLEHVENPFLAISESHRVLKKGGIAIHTTCFINQYHLSPLDYWRFSPETLKYLCKDFSEIIEYGGWGNRLAIFICFLGDRFRTIEIPNKGLRHWLGTFNEKRYPISTWVIARK